MMQLRPAAGLVLFASMTTAADLPKFSTTLKLVQTDAYVYDRQTKAPIVDLQASDFIIFDEDQVRQVVYFAEDAGPLDLLLLLDVSGSMRELLPGLADRATNALSILQATDRAAVMAFTKTTALTQPLTADLVTVTQGIRAAMSVRIGLDTDINQAVWAGADYLHNAGGASRRAILILTDNIQETTVPDSLIDEQISQAGAVLDGLLVRGPIPIPRVTHPGILGFARNSGGEVIEGNQPAERLADMIRRIKFRYSMHFRPAEGTSARPRKIHVSLTEEARRRYPNAVVRARRLYFPQGAYKPKPRVPVNSRIAWARTHLESKIH